MGTLDVHAATIEARLATLSPSALRRAEADRTATIEPAPRMPLLSLPPPESLEVHGTLGEGGMGVVYLATQGSVGRKVAVKALRAEHRTPESEARLLQEAWVAGALEHPNVVPVYDVQAREDGPRVVLKRVEGVDWATLLEREDLLAAHLEGQGAEEFHLRVLMQVCDAVHFAHEHGILHRDLKPENVMIGSYGEVYLVDWGIAVAYRDGMDPRLPKLEDAYDLAGTPAYMAPEMLTGDPNDLGPLTDVYLLGATLFHVLTGGPPHVASTLEATLASVLAPPPELPSRVSKELAALCRDAMASSPGKRPPTARDLKQRVQLYLQHRESRHLAMRAQRALTDLLEELGSASAEDEARIEDRYRAVTFGFQAALESWPDNPVALGGVRLAARSIVGHHVRRGDLRAAQRVLGTMDDPPGELVRDVEALEQAEAASVRHHERLEALNADLDAAIGSRTRTFVAGGLGTIWSALPIGMHFAVEAWGLEPSPRFSLRVALGSLVVVGGLGIWARETIRKTALNRTVFSLLVLVLLAQVVLDVTVGTLGFEGPGAVTLNFFLWFVCAGVATVVVDRRFVVAAVAYVACLVLAIQFPEELLLLAGAGNAVFTLCALVIWLPMMADTRTGRGGGLVDGRR